MMKYTKLIILGFGLIGLSLLALVGPARAQSFQAGDSVNVARNDTINSMLFASGNSVNIAGTVNGDVYCAGQTITISGTVNGDVFCAGQSVVVTGKIDGSVRLAGQTVNLDGAIIGGSATIAAQSLVIDKNAVINRDLVGAGQTIIIDGLVNRDVVAGMKNLAVNGQIGRNLKGYIGTLVVGPVGQIGGNVDYTGNADPAISAGGQIVGSVNRTAPKDQSVSSPMASIAVVLGWLAYMFISILVLALVLIGLWPRVISRTTSQAMDQPGRTALVGALAAIMLPILVVLLLVSAIGMPLAGLTLLLWGTIALISTPLAGYALGRLLLPKSSQPLVIMALGTSVLLVTYFVPFIGFITGLMAYIFGMGAVLTYGHRLRVRAEAKKSRA